MTVPAQVDSTTGYTVPLIISGKECRPGKSFDVVSPATGMVVHKCSSASEGDASAATAAAAEALRTWRRTSPKRRRDILLKAADVMERRGEELIGYLMDETSCSRPWGELNVRVSREFLIDVAGRISSLEGTLPITDDEGVGAMVLKEPYGVVLAIAPWNSPYILATRAVAFPIAAGNTVVLKGSELSPRVMWALFSVLEEAGLPAGVLNVIFHEPASAATVTRSLVAHPDIKKISFTGSTAVGRVIAKLAGDHLKPVLLELGGKAPAIVWEDADLDNAATQCALGAFLNSGQICMSTERILVHKNVRAEFEQKLKVAVASIFDRQPDGLVLIHGPAAQRNRALLRDAVAKGASMVYGEIGTGDIRETRMRPVVISGVSEDMDIYQTESFGPSVSLFEVGTEEEALRIANDTDYGLTSAVFTEDLRRGLRFAKSIETGAVHINNMTVHDETALPHGGAKSSGFGRFNAQGINEWVRTKTVTYKI